MNIMAALIVAAMGALPMTEGVVKERPGGLLSCESLPGEARVASVPRPIFVPKADGSPVALCFVPSGEGDAHRVNVFYIEMTTGQVRSEVMPEKLGNPWGRVWGPDGKLYFGLWGPATMIRYDPAANRLDYFGDIEPAPQYKGVPVLTVGTDEKVYAIAAGYVFSIDPATDRVTRYGHQGPARKYRVAYTGSLAVDDEFIYSTFGNVASEVFTVAANKTTGEQTLLKEIQGARFQQQRLGVTAALNKQEYWMVKGRPVAKLAADEKAPWPERPPAERKAPPTMKGKPEFLPGLRERDGRCAVRYRADPGEEWKTLTLSLPTEPVGLSRILALPDGRLVASTNGYEGLNSFDPKTGAFAFVGMIPLSHYSSRIVGDKVYLAGYPGGSGLWEWDPAKPWTISADAVADPNRAGTREDANPRRLPPWDKPGNFQFPLFFMQGADKALYVAVHGERSDIGGLISWRELDTGKRGFIREPFESYDPAGFCAALNGTKLVLSTFAVDGLNGRPRPESGRLFVLDVATRQVEWSMDPLPGVDCAGFVVETQPGVLLLAADHRIGWSYARFEEGRLEGSYLYTVDMTTRRVTRAVRFPGILAGRREYFWHVDFQRGPDGMVYTFYDDRLVRINPATLEVTALSVVKPAGCIAFSGQDIYISGTPHFRRVAGATLLP